MARIKHERVQNGDIEAVSDCESINETFSNDEEEISVDLKTACHDDWIEKYTPIMASDICIHPRKLKDVREVLQGMLRGKDSHRLLVLSGPAGSSKSTSVKVLAKELLSSSAKGGGLDLYRETGADNLNLRPAESWIEYLDEASDISQPARFLNFLDDARYRTGNNLCVVVVEELPNVFHKVTLDRFRGAILEWIYSDSVAVPPLVLCVTEVESFGTQNRDHFSLDNNLTVETLLGREILAATDKVKRVLFNPIARTYLKRTLGSIISAERNVFKGIQRGELDSFMEHILESGDVRSAISNLQFWATLRHHQGLDNYDFLRESQLGLFHALGKIVFSSSKYKSLDADELDLKSVELVLSSYGNSSLLLLASLENYHVVNGLNYKVATAANITEALSASDCIPGPEGKDYGIGTVRNELRKVQSQSSSGRSLSLQFPRQYKMSRNYNRVHKEILQYRDAVCHLKTSFLDLNLIDGYLAPRIYNSFRYKLKYGSKKYEYNRLGGRFKEIHSDPNALVDDLEYGETIRDQFQQDIENCHHDNGGDSDSLSDPISESESSDFLSDSDLEGLISQGMV